MNRGRERDGYLKKRGEGRKGGCLPRGRKAKTGEGLGFIKRKKVVVLVDGLLVKYYKNLYSYFIGETVKMKKGLKP